MYFAHRPRLSLKGFAHHTLPTTANLYTMNTLSIAISWWGHWRKSEGYHSAFLFHLQQMFPFEILACLKWVKWLKRYVTSSHIQIRTSPWVIACILSFVYLTLFVEETKLFDTLPPILVEDPSSPLQDDEGVPYSCGKLPPIVSLPFGKSYEYRTFRKPESVHTRERAWSKESATLKVTSAVVCSTGIEKI